jgi:hypothetical protein
MGDEVTVSLVTTWQVAPAKLPEFIALGPDAKRSSLALGASSYRGFRTRVGGANTGAFISVIEFANNEALGRFLDTSPNDAEFSGLVAQASGMADSFSTATLEELDLG